jgi:hypothetical protein
MEKSSEKGGGRLTLNQVKSAKWPKIKELGLAKSAVLEAERISELPVRASRALRWLASRRPKKTLNLVKSLKWSAGFSRRPVPPCNPLALATNSRVSSAPFWKPKPSRRRLWLSLRLGLTLAVS